MKIEIKIITYSLLCCLLLNSCSKKKEKNNVERPKPRVEHKETKIKLQIKQKIPSQQKTKKHSSTNLSAKINEINDLLLNGSELPFSNENKLKNLLKKMNLELLSKDERLKEGINNLTEAANKVFDLSRPLSEKDIEDIKRLNPRQLDQLIVDAFGTHQNIQRNLLLCEIGLDKSNPLYLRGESALIAIRLKKAIGEPYYDLINYQKKMFDECININDSDKDNINIAVNTAANLNSYYWKKGEYGKVAEIAEDSLILIDKLPTYLAIIYRGGAILSATKSFARTGHLDKALKLIEESKNIEISKNSKKRLLSEKYKKELNNYYKEYQYNEKN